MSAGSQVLIRAAFFRICCDSALRGPDSTLVASYVSHTWRLGARRYREFHCNDPVYLRVTSSGGDHQRHGPYEHLRVAEGGLFVSGRCIGVHSTNRDAENSVHPWHEVTMLPAGDPLI
jgi:hypothetical protein